MARAASLGAFEQLVLLAVARLGGDTYGMAIRREIQDRTGRAVSIGAVYATLDRLDAKGLVQPRPEPGEGRARRLFSITSTGVASLEASRQVQARMWAGLRLGRAGRP